MTKQETTRVSIIEEPGVKHRGQFLEHGNAYTLPNNEAAALCKAGFAESVDGAIETGERNIHRRVVVEPASSNHAATTEG